MEMVKIELLHPLKEYAVAIVLSMKIDGEPRLVVFNQKPSSNGSGLCHIQFYLYVEQPNRLWSGIVREDTLVGEACRL
jgi:hypothetical protein